jgi:rod shape-determining protein MreB
MLNIKKLKEYFTCDLAIDLGTSHTTIIDKHRGLVVDEPSIVAVLENYGQLSVIAVGDEAFSMVGKVPRNHRIVSPMRNGVVSDFDISEYMLTSFITKALDGHPNRFFKPHPRVVITVPVGATQVEQRTIKELALKSGATEVHLLEQPLASGIGSNLDLDSHEGHIVIHIGAGLTEIAVLSMNDIVTHKTIEVGGDHLTNAIIQHFRYSYSILLSKHVAEKIKIELADPLPSHNDSDEEITLNVTGKDTSTNLPKDFVVTKKEVYKAIIHPLGEIVNAFLTTLEVISPEIATDILNNGIVLTGGGAKLINLSDFFEKITGIETIVADDPEYTAVNGCLKVLDED